MSLRIYANAVVCKTASRCAREFCAANATLHAVLTLLLNASALHSFFFGKERDSKKANILNSCAIFTNPYCVLV